MASSETCRTLRRFLTSFLLEAFIVWIIGAGARIHLDYIDFFINGSDRKDRWLYWNGMFLFGGVWCLLNGGSRVSHAIHLSLWEYKSGNLMINSLSVMDCQLALYKLCLSGTNIRKTQFRSWIGDACNTLRIRRQGSLVPVMCLRGWKQGGPGPTFDYGLIDTSQARGYPDA